MLGGHLSKILLLVLLAALLGTLGAVRAHQPQGESAAKVRAGVGGVGTPQCVYCPQPEYSDQALKAKYSGYVLLDVTVTSGGKVTDPVVVKGPGLGLEEKAIDQVHNWRMKPALGPNGKAVDCRVQIQMTFKFSEQASQRP